MRKLDDLLNRLLTQNLSSEKITVQLIIRKLEAIGVVLDSNKLDELEDKLIKQIELSDPNSDVLHFELGDDIVSNLSEALKQQIEELEITANDIEEFEAILQKKIEEKIPQIVFAVAEEMYRLLKADMNGYLKQRRKDSYKYSQRLIEAWQKPMNLLEILIVTCYELGADFNTFYRPSSSEKNDFVFDALTRLHARGCQVASEIIVLMSSGFADGAHARWRTLHEIAIIASFISEHGQEVGEKYLLHNVIDIYKEMVAYQEHCTFLGMEPLSEETIEDLSLQRTSLLERFGKNFGRDYGWAGTVNGNPEPTLVDLERDIDVTHLRPFVKDANRNVHASARGTLFRLGLPPNPDILLAGPSFWGMDVPGRNTAYSLAWLTVTLITYQTSFSDLIAAKIIQNFTVEIYKEFNEVALKVQS